MTVKQQTAHRLRMAALAGGTLLAAAALLWRPQAVAGGISRGLAVCGQVLIPSLFPFLVLSGFIIRSGVAAAVGRRLEWITRRVFGLPGCCAAGLVIGAVGGYPAGGAAVGDLVRSGQLDRDEARRMLRCCINGGPGFVVSAVGTGMMGSAAFGWLLFAAHLLAAFILGVVGAPRGSRRRTVVRTRRPTVVLPATAALVESVTGACETLLIMCGFVSLFAAATALIDVSGVVGWLAGGHPPAEKLVGALIACVLEVSGGCTAAASLGGNAPLFLGFAVGFAGLSVQCQLAASLRGLGILGADFFAARVAQGALTAVLACLLYHCIPLSEAVWGTWQTPVVQAASGSAAVSAALLVLCGVWLLTVGEKSESRGEKRAPSP